MIQTHKSKFFGKRMKLVSVAALLVGLSFGMSVVYAQQQAASGGIYSCTDAKGRKLTSDRPILECIDREQNIHNPSGTVKGKIGPTLTAQERAALEEKEKLEQQEKARVEEERRRDKALLVRYPTRAVHDRERAEAVGQIGVVIQAANNRTNELRKQRASLDTEMEFYKKDPTKAPASVRRQIEDNENSQAVQKRFISDQEAEIKRVHARFDDELDRLKPLWQASVQAAPVNKTKKP